MVDNQFPSEDQNPFAYSSIHDQRPPINHGKDVNGKMLAAGVAMLVVGILGFVVMGGIFVISLVMMQLQPDMFQPVGIDMDEQQQAAHTTSMTIAFGIYGVSGLMQIPVILAGIGLMKAKWKSFTFIGAIINVIPCCSSCFLLGIPFGIWALVVLSDPDVRARFNT